MFGAKTNRAMRKDALARAKRCGFLRNRQGEFVDKCCFETSVPSLSKTFYASIGHFFFMMRPAGPHRELSVGPASYSIRVRLWSSVVFLRCL